MKWFVSCLLVVLIGCGHFTSDKTGVISNRSKIRVQRTSKYLEDVVPKYVGRPFWELTGIVGHGFRVKGLTGSPHLSRDWGGRNLVTYILSHDGVEFEIAVGVSSDEIVREIAIQSLYKSGDAVQFVRIYEEGKWREERSLFGPILKGTSVSR